MPERLSWEFWAKAWEFALELRAKSNQALYNLALTKAREFWEFWAKDTDGLYHLALIVGGLYGLRLLTVRTRAVDLQAKTAAKRHKKQTAADRERRITESFAKAVEQLGGAKLETRLGGIYTLERIARESERDHWPIMETLTAYVRERAPWPPPLTAGQSEMEAEIASSFASSFPETETEPASGIRPATDIQAILTVLVRRDETARQRDQAAGRRLDLRKTDLRGAFLAKAHLEDADLVEAHLEGAFLAKAHLEGAGLVKAHLEGADLIETHLEGAFLAKAHLEGAGLVKAHLEGAFLAEAHLEGACLDGAHLEEASLWEAHLEGARLWGAHLERAHLNEAHLERAHLNEAHLEGAGLDGAHLEGADLGGTDITQEQVDAAIGDERTQIPKGLTRPEHWRPAEGDDEQQGRLSRDSLLRP